MENTIIQRPNGDAVVEAVKEIMSAACGIETEQCECLPEDICKEGAAIAVISVMGSGIEWSIYQGFPRTTAMALCQAFAGFEIPFESEDMGDAIGEVANILAGGIKNILDKRGVHVEISLPSVMRVDGLHILKQHGSRYSKACFTSSIGQFWVGVVSGKTMEIVA